MLAGRDALLGPWLPGQETLEDELRCFAGERQGLVWGARKLLVRRAGRVGYASTRLACGVGALDFAARG